MSIHACELLKEKKRKGNKGKTGSSVASVKGDDRNLRFEIRIRKCN